nr:membrane protein m119.3 [Mastomys natalensis cytomegalovirus 3]WEG69939.1 membrane protein m119.3 [Mastomys natalensis cytomegalovirus 3]WEG70079.1 membrane protein m119.3 [Mastomys natalensis cytomegalovirus 3]WEG70219.1 membrane protein m119.3 [Mastomys natalensis cytomegalovirus 3]WEG70359.1 membrane protein m119.3 [Mastomys natalensis cytomegalovirus 3]
MRFAPIFVCVAASILCLTISSTGSNSTTPSVLSSNTTATNATSKSINSTAAAATSIITSPQSVSLLISFLPAALILVIGWIL